MRTSARSTSIAAYHDHRASVKCLQQRDAILNFISARGGDWSIGEIAKALDLQKSTVSARINELINETKQLAERPKRKDRISHILIRPVGLPVGLQGDLFQ